MNTTMKIVLSVMIGIVLTIGPGCAPAKKVWVSYPMVQSTYKPYYNARLEPLTRNHDFFVSFRLTLSNKTDKNLAIDWNKTRYIHNGRTRGGFVFKGIKPEDVKNSTIPSDTILAGGFFSHNSSLRLNAGVPFGIHPCQRRHNGQWLIPRQFNRLEPQIHHCLAAEPPWPLQDSVVTDQSVMDLRVDGRWSPPPDGGFRALRLEAGPHTPPSTTPPSPPHINLIGGIEDNFLGLGVIGATIGGGGDWSPFANRVLVDFGTVSGGCDQEANGWAATIGGG